MNFGTTINAELNAHNILILKDSNLLITTTAAEPNAHKILKSKDFNIFT